MAAITQSLKYGSFVYDFAVDGGAIGTISMGKFIPGNCTVIYGYAKIITTFTSGGASTVSIGFVSAPLAFLNGAALGSLTAGAALSGVDLTDSPFSTQGGQQLALTISTATITAGKLVYYYQYVELDANISFAVMRGIGFDAIGINNVIG